jgi:hypothetical protein
MDSLHEQAGVQTESVRANLTVEGMEKKKLTRGSSAGKNYFPAMALKDILSLVAALRVPVEVLAGLRLAERIMEFQELGPAFCLALRIP